MAVRRGVRRVPGRRPLYPWKAWFSKDKFLVVQGTHFHCAVHGMIQQIRTKAMKLGISVSIETPNYKTIEVTVWRDTQ